MEHISLERRTPCQPSTKTKDVSSQTRKSITNQHHTSRLLVFFLWHNPHLLRLPLRPKQRRNQRRNCHRHQHRKHPIYRSTHTTRRKRKEESQFRILTPLENKQWKWTYIPISIRAPQSSPLRVCSPQTRLTKRQRDETRPMERRDIRNDDVCKQLNTTRCRD